MNYRSIIRKAIKERLHQRTSARDNIRVGRSNKEHPKEGYYIEIYTPDENIQSDSESEATSPRRSLDMLIELKIVSEHIDHELMHDLVDEFTNEVEEWLPPDSIYIEGVDHFRLESTKINIVTVSEMLHGSAYLIYNIKYNSDDAPTDKFQTTINDLTETMSVVDGTAILGKDS